MSGSGPTPAEQHLGDRLAALVDGELNHDVRERVLSHLASCPKCKAEADAQRRLKSVFAETAPPPPSEGLLARLQGLPGGPGGDDTGRGGSGPFGGGRFADGVYGLTSSSRGFPPDPRESFGYVPARPHPAAAAGFPIHPVGRQDTDRSSFSSRRRFAFAAASAVSLAAIALGGAMPNGAPTGATSAGAQGGGTAAPQQSGGQAVVGTEILRRQGGGAASVPTSEEESRPPVTATSTSSVVALSAPVVSTGPLRAPLSHPLSAALLTGSSLPPLIPATASTPPVTPSPGVTPAATQLAGAPQLTRH
ncbi:anti-sigma factor family protein [Streptomyces sp. NBC_01465]|uniref:anti-sigma factor family protein n=1 Tax=Streptomyces sp. NBC_01465 TaxID=2903878 RepID=UPI002E36F34B|nr:zf-HC2 domain-containing protein [Streptomyces sp. NBC_01465]